MQDYFCNRSVNKRPWYWPLIEWAPRTILKHEFQIFKYSSRVCGQMFIRNNCQARVLCSRHCQSVESAVRSHTNIMVLKIRAKKEKTKTSYTHWKVVCIMWWVIFFFFLHYSEEPLHIKMANTWTEKHELIGREQNKPLHWPFFKKLWSWPLEEKDKTFFFFKFFFFKSPCFG